MNKTKGSYSWVIDYTIMIVMMTIISALFFLTILPVIDGNRSTQDQKVEAKP